MQGERGNSKGGGRKRWGREGKGRTDIKVQKISKGEERMKTAKREKSGQEVET